MSPSLALQYNSGSGNGPFGLGWELSLPAIQRRTDKWLPTYQDSVEGDVFQFSGEEDLVPLLTETNGNWSAPPPQPGGYVVQVYRPRIEGRFARIEKITSTVRGVHWRVTTRDNITTLFGRTPLSRIADPQDATRIFKWLPEFSYDSKGNWISYVYKEDSNLNPDDQAAIPKALHEANRKNGNALFINRYLKQVQYGNHTPYYPSAELPYDPPAPSRIDPFFLLIFDYGDHDAKIPTADETPGLTWAYRSDAFSSYRSGFEIRTARICQRVLLFHFFNELGQTPCLVRSLDLAYEPSSINGSGFAEVTYLASATDKGYIRLADNSYSSALLPAMTFQYQTLQWNKTVQTVSAENIANAPVGLTNNYQWLDLYGEGVPGIFTEQGDGWFYKTNISNAGETAEVFFTAARIVAPRPSPQGFNGGLLQLQDLDGNGQKQIVARAGALQGFFQLTGDNQWEPFRPFQQSVSVDLRNPYLRSIDLNGDGRPDLVITEDDVFTWYPSAGKAGYDEAMRTVKHIDEEKGPAVLFADPLQTIFLADMTGDGLTDIVRIRNGEICYWANKGYGRFSAKVNMGSAPLFDTPEAFNPAYLHLADISGTGPTDILYLGKNQFTGWLNLGGNSWGAGVDIPFFAPVNNRAKLAAIDLLGTGTTCIVWSTDLPTETPMRFIDLMNGHKPHLLIGYDNNLGKELSIQYRSSTHFYNRDKIEGKPWITKLAFPVQVVQQTVLVEQITNVRFSTSYRYHHGYYDAVEKEFRGFGLVEQTDSEQYDTWVVSAAGTSLDDDPGVYQPPVLTRTWFHTGVYFEREKLLTQYETEYWYNEIQRQGFAATGPEPALPDGIIIPSPIIQDKTIMNRLAPGEWREAFRACKGMVLRQEVFALDALATGASAAQLELQLTPYSVTTHNCAVQLLQPRAGNRYDVYLVTESEALSIYYERATGDPRLTHTVNVVLDELGNVLESAKIAYGRSSAAAAQLSASLAAGITSFGGVAQYQQAYADHLTNLSEAQQQTSVAYMQTLFTTDSIAGALVYRLRQPALAQTYELTGLTPSGLTPTSVLFSLDDFTGVLTDGVTTLIGYQQPPSPAQAQRRLIEDDRTLYYTEDLSGAAAQGILTSHGLVYQHYQLAYTPLMLSNIFGTKLSSPDTSLAAAGFVHYNDKNWWIPSGVVQYLNAGDTLATVKSRFFTPVSYTDPLSATTTVQYYLDYFLLLQSVTDALQSVTRAETFNFRTLSPTLLRDANDNLSAILQDELGLVKAVALLGKDLDHDNVAELQLLDDLSGLTEVTPAAETVAIQAFFAQADSTVLMTDAGQLLQHATARFVYDLGQYTANGKPVSVATILREQHYSTVPNSALQLHFEYSDGLGRVAMTKKQAKPGPAQQLQVAADGSFTLGTVDTSTLNPPQLCWIGNGRTVLNNKGNPVKQYEPYFSVNPFYEDADDLVETGVTPIIYYDAPGRKVKTLLPDGSIASTVFGVWGQSVSDPNDNSVGSSWYTERVTGPLDPKLVAEGLDPAKEKAAALKAAAHAGTPNQLFLDPLGRAIFSIDDVGLDTNGQHQFFGALSLLDIENNTLGITDARGNPVGYTYDMLGHRVYENSMDAGERWTLLDVLSQPVYRWDNRAHIFYWQYDGLHRPSAMTVQGGDGDLTLSTPYTHEKIVYGESLTDLTQGRAGNFRGKPIRHYDTAGLVSLTAYDLKGNLLASTRQLIDDDRATPDWSGPTIPSATTYATTGTYDALNRVTSTTAPDGSVTSYTFNATALLETVTVVQNGNSTTFVQSIDYDEKGQREKIVYGNSVNTVYTYDVYTFRLIGLLTRDGKGNPLQDLSYTYDPVGNIVQLEDQCIPTVFYANYMVDGNSTYTYDPLYRLINATGREHAGQLNYDINDNWQDLPFLTVAAPGDSLAWQNYQQAYGYDPTGNILQLQHTVNSAGWQRNYQYETGTNRLVQTQIQGSPYVYKYPHHPQHGFMTAMPHLSLMQWNFKDELRTTAQQQVNNGTPPTTWYVYDGAGQRVRKITRDSQGNKLNERIYLGSVELYLEYGGANVQLERDTLHVLDDKRRIAMIETLQTENGKEASSVLVRYQLSDHLGSSSLELSGDTASPQVISYEEYHPYGTTSYQAMNKSIQAAAKRYRYTGLERDEETGFGYHGARYYVLWLGRWTAPDPLGYSGGSLYSYGANNPIKFVDRQGQKEEPITIHVEGAGNYPVSQAFEAVQALAQGKKPKPPPLPLSVNGSTVFLPQLEGGAASLTKQESAPTHTQPLPRVEDVLVNTIVLFPFEPFLGLLSLSAVDGDKSARQARQALRPLPYAKGQEGIGGALETGISTIATLGFGLAASAASAPSKLAGAGSLAVEATGAGSRAPASAGAAAQGLAAGAAKYAPTLAEQGCS